MSAKRCSSTFFRLHSDSQNPKMDEVCAAPSHICPHPLAVTLVIDPCIHTHSLMSISRACEHYAHALIAVTLSVRSHPITMHSTANSFASTCLLYATCKRQLLTQQACQCSSHRSGIQEAHRQCQLYCRLFCNGCDVTSEKHMNSVRQSVAACI